MPGFIDIHSHGADGVDCCDESPDAISKIARTKLREGVTMWLPTTLTLPPERLLEVARNCADYMADPKFCRVPGLHLEGPFINRANAGAQNPQFIRPADIDEVKKLHEIARVMIVSLAPELPGALDFIKSAVAMGIVCSSAHSSAKSEEIEAAKLAGASHLTHFCNAMTPLHHRAIGAVGAGLLDDDLMLEIICDATHLVPDMLRLIFKIVPMDRLMLITDSTAASWIGEGDITLGGLPVEVKAGVARLRESGALAGSALRYNEGLMVAEGPKLPLRELVKATSWNQARSLGLEGFGKIEPGYHADLVLLDKDFAVRKTFVAGEER